MKQALRRAGLAAYGDARPNRRYEAGMGAPGFPRDLFGLQSMDRGGARESAEGICRAGIQGGRHRGECRILYAEIPGLDRRERLCHCRRTDHENFETLAAKIEAAGLECVSGWSGRQPPPSAGPSASSATSCTSSRMRDAAEAVKRRALREFANPFLHRCTVSPDINHHR
jgi:hypothetical protein